MPWLCERDSDLSSPGGGTQIVTCLKISPRGVLPVVQRVKDLALSGLRCLLKKKKKKKKSTAPPGYSDTKRSVEDHFIRGLKMKNKCPGKWVSFSL